ncbi:MAG: segregation/condensation protein A [Candidatus Sungbacteria bacterium]|uniref:Segregation and condensation protein A n=1 Tax=Candidatus Sungiibacteriota bacterium TaxID=2750080 RepID=A0A9D6DQW9_9BACT|nr:segregation/condensation protein A [Candidatus Sungbacteria bacterium]
MYHIKLEKFEGPLDLLHQLIESKKLEITEISLAEVSDQFLGYLKNSKRLALEDLADFLNVAGRLCLIKSRALLPFLQLTEAEEKDVQNLKEQLVEYQKYKELAGLLGRLDRKADRIYARAYLAALEPIFYFPKKLTGESLAGSLENLIHTLTLPQRIPQAHMVSKISLAQKLEEIQNKIKEKTELNFFQITDPKNSEEKMVAFMAVLELLKRSQISAEQKINFEDIKLKWLIQEC